MKKKYYILVLTFLCMLVEQSSYAQTSSGDYGWDIDLPELCVGAGCDDGGGGPDSGDPCDPWSSAYDYYTCHGGNNNDSGDPCDPFSNAYNPYQCGGDTGDPCDPYSYAFDYNVCYGEPTNPDPNPCSETSIAAGVAATNLLESSVVSATMSQMPMLFPSNQPPYSQQLEHGFNIKNIGGIISTTPIREGTATGLPAADYTVNVVADLHDHPAPGTFAPTAQDLFSLHVKRDAMSGFKTSYVSSFDGNIYALYIDDPIKLKAFVTNNSGFVGSDNNFKVGTTVGDYFWDVNFDLQRQGYTAQEAYTRATTLILKDAGVSLLKTGAQTIDFKKIDIDVVGDDPNGNTIIIVNDCN